MDRGAWWAAVYGVAQSRTQLKRLSMYACIGEGNGNPLQYSCLENPVDGWVRAEKTGDNAVIQVGQGTGEEGLAPRAQSAGV